MDKNEMTTKKEKTEVEELHEFAKQWKSDLDFFWDDLQFLSHLMENYFVWIIEKGNVDDVRILNDSLNELKRKCRKLLKQLGKHMEQVAQSFESVQSLSTEHLSEAHKRLNKDMSELTKEFRAVKRDVFVISEHAVDIKRLQFLA